MFNRCRIALVLTLFPLYAITRSPSVFRRNKIKMNKVNLFFGDFSEVKTILKRNVSDGLTAMQSPHIVGVLRWNYGALTAEQ